MSKYMQEKPTWHYEEPVTGRLMTYTMGYVTSDYIPCMALFEGEDIAPVLIPVDILVHGIEVGAEKESNLDPDLLYGLTISGDLADYYDGERGEGAFDALTPEQQQSLARAVEKALSGFMEDRYIAFDAGIDDAGL
tara:strand:+ start:134 stop:541 length:408 start_codon:yes stop_codon:yes gene_type:complete